MLSGRYRRRCMPPTSTAAQGVRRSARPISSAELRWIPSSPEPRAAGPEAGPCERSRLVGCELGRASVLGFDGHQPVSCSDPAHRGAELALGCAASCSVSRRMGYEARSGLEAADLAAAAMSAAVRSIARRRAVRMPSRPRCTPLRTCTTRRLRWDPARTCRRDWVCPGSTSCCRPRPQLERRRRGRYDYRGWTQALLASATIVSAALSGGQGSRRRRCMWQRRTTRRCRFYRSVIYPLLRRVSIYLRRWAGRKYRRLRTLTRFRRWWARVIDRAPDLFAHWRWVRTC